MEDKKESGSSKLLKIRSFLKRQNYTICTIRTQLSSLPLIFIQPSLKLLLFPETIAVEVVERSENLRKLEFYLKFAVMQVHGSNIKPELVE